MGSKVDLLEVVRKLDENTIRQRLAELEGESVALRTLLRSILARNHAVKRGLPRAVHEVRQ